MNKSFKPLALAAAVSAVSVGTAGVANAGSYPSVGDAAFVPYYTVQENWVTGVHIINSSPTYTQVIKVRLRRAEGVCAATSASAPRRVLLISCLTSPHVPFPSALCTTTSSIGSPRGSRSTPSSARPSTRRASM